MKRHTIPLAAVAMFLFAGLVTVGHVGCGGGNSVVPTDGAVGNPGADSGPSCTPNFKCRNTLDCGTGTCVGGVCQCGGNPLCYKDADCAAGKCCNLVANSCYDCSGSDGGPSDTGTNGDTGGQKDVGVKDTGTQSDGSEPCQSDFQCPDLAKSHCNTAMGVCVECLQDGHCNGGTCNLTTYTCEGGQDAGVTDGGVVTDSGVDDGGADPCSGYSCICGSYCQVTGGSPTCISGCRNQGDCCSGDNCTNGTCGSATCTSDSDCTNTLQPYCDTASGNCYECVYDYHCTSPATCDQGTHTCGSGPTCSPPCDPATEYCDPNTLTCMPSGGTKMCQACTSFADCIGGGQILTCGIFMKVCTKSCTSDADCFGQTCGTMSGYCCGI